MVLMWRKSSSASDEMELVAKSESQVAQPFQKEQKKIPRELSQLFTRTEKASQANRAVKE